MTTYKSVAHPVPKARRVPVGRAPTMPVMGMIFAARPLTNEELSAVRADHSVAEDLLLGPDPEEDDGGADDEAMVDVDKAWHGIHFLLTRTAWESTSALGWVILGGEPLENTDAGYGPVRLLEPAQVEAIAAALAETNDAALRQRFDPAAMQRAEIYPSIWDEGQSVLDEYLLPNLAALRRMYAEAAARGAAVIAGIS